MVLKSRTTLEDAGIQYRVASFSELSAAEVYSMLELRQRVFVLEQECLFPDIDGADQDFLHLLAFDGSKLVGYTRIGDVGLSYPDALTIGRVIIEESYRGRGLAYPLMRESIDAARGRYGMLPITIGAQAHLQGLYRHIGFVASSSEYDEDGIMHIDMTLEAPSSSGGEQQELSKPQAVEKEAAPRTVAPSVGKVVPTNAASSRRSGNVMMGLFDELRKAFENEEFKEDDQRVRASHILCKGDDDIERVTEIMAELGGRVQQEPDKLVPIFAELARRESECSSSSVGGDLGLFGPGKMVQEFDAVLFPEDAAQAPPAGAVLGPVVTEFGCHLILVTKREVNRDQIEEKLARND